MLQKMADEAKNIQNPTRRQFVASMVLAGAGIAVFGLDSCQSGEGQTSQTSENSATSASPSTSSPASSVNGQLITIPAGKFSMGDHIGYVDPGHPSDELPIHSVNISQFFIAKYDVTVSEYCDYLNSAMSQGLINVSGGSYPVTGGPRGTIGVSDGLVYLNANKELVFITREAYNHGTVSWSNKKFSILENRDRHPITGVTWCGAAAFCNWLSLREGYQPGYDLNNWQCDFSKNGYRLPTEAEWEYAARGGQYNPYFNYPWGNDADKTRANWPNSVDPYENGSLPLTTPVGFYDGQLHRKSDFGWPGSQETYQTANGANSFGLYDMCGNVWQWCNDWYSADYYSVSPSTDPTGPSLSQASPMPDGKPYRVLRGGNWYNGEPDKFSPNIDNGHSRVSNRDPAYYLGQEEYQPAEVGFRIVRRG